MLSPRNISSNSPSGLGSWLSVTQLFRRIALSSGMMDTYDGHVGSTLQPPSLGPWVLDGHSLQSGL